MSLPKIAKKLKNGEILHFSFGPDGGRLFWLEPSNKKITRNAALRAISCDNVQAAGDSLPLPFGTTPQSWVWVDREKRAKMDSEDAVYQDFSDGNLNHLDAIERLQKLGYDPKDAEQAVSEWADAMEANEKRPTQEG